MVERKQFERLKPRPSHKSAPSTSELDATSSYRLSYLPRVLCSEALGRKRGVATDRSPGSQNSSTELVCAYP